jgi:hypothetical protein
MGKQNSFENSLCWGYGSNSRAILCKHEVQTTVPHIYTQKLFEAWTQIPHLHSSGSSCIQVQMHGRLQFSLSEMTFQPS